MTTVKASEVGIYILIGLPMKEWNWGGTKLSEGQLFTFRDRQDSCLPRAARLDSPGDQGKGKVGPNVRMLCTLFSTECKVTKTILAPKTQKSFI